MFGSRTIKMNVKILIVDDQPMLLKGLCQALAEQPRFALVGEASSGELALKLALELRPELVVMDIHLPKMDGIEVIRQILRALPATKIVIFSGDSAATLVDEALQAGACGYILKSGAVKDLIHAIDEVMAGRLCLSPVLSTTIVEDYQRRLFGGPEPSKLVLSEREKQLLRLIAEGRRNKEIAAKLKLSVNSIETYRSRLMKKVGCPSAAQLARYAVREGIAAR
jgi:DNA-binding NarL/FixJ family response regulator